MKSLIFVFLLFTAILQDRQVTCMFIFGMCKDIWSNSTALQLKDHLFCAYDDRVRPTENHRNATVVNFGLYIRQFEVDELTNTVSFHTWTRVMWTDPYLTWTPSQFDGLEWLHVMNHDIWLPDIVLHSATYMDIDMEMPTIECWLHHQGTIFCVPAMMYTTSCEFDHTWWPYDTMNCSLHIASWSHSTDEMDLEATKFDDEEGLLTFRNLENNTEWELTKITVSEHLVGSKFGVEFTSKMLEYRVILQRYSSMYSAAYMTFTLVLVTMTLLTLWLEPKSTERMVIANFNFILHLFSLQDLQWCLPFNGPHVPKLLLFYENSFVLATFSLVLTNVLRHVQELNTDAPAWISSATISILKSRVGQVFLVSILDPKVSATMEINADDNTNLVSFNNKKESTWKYTSILIGWIAFFSVLLVYVIMFAIFLPTRSSGKLTLNT